MSSSGSIYRTDTAGAGGIHITTNAIYPGNSSGGIVNGSTSLGATSYRFNTLYSAGVDNSGTITTQDIVVSGNLTVTGTTTQSTQTSSQTSANTVLLLSSVTGSPTANASFEVERGSSTNAKMLWDEANNRFDWNFPGYFTGGVASSSYVTAASYMHITAAGGAQHLLIGNQDSAGVNKPALIMGVNGYLRFGHGNSWSGTGGTFTETINLASNHLDVTGGAIKVGGTTVIDSSRNIYPASIHSTSKMSFLNGSAAQGIRVNTLYAGTTYASDGAASGQVDALNGYRVAGTTVIDSSRQIAATGSTFTTSGTHYSSGTVGLIVKDAGAGRGTVRIRTDNDNAAELFLDVNGAIRWDISARPSSDSYDLNFYSQGSTPSYTTVAGPALQLKQNGDVKVQTALYTGGTVRISSTGALTNVSGNISQFTNNSGYITSADGGNAALLDSLDSTDFIRRGSSYGTVLNTPNASNQVRFENASGQSMNSASGNLSRLEVFQATVGADAFMQFHVGGDYAFYFGIDGVTNDLSVGGWSMGAAKYRVYHSGNINSQTMDIGTVVSTNRATFKKGIDLDRDVSNASGISWYSTGHHTWQEYMSSVSVAGCGPNANITSPAGAHGVTSWALRSYIENVTGYGWTWESGGSSTATGTVMMGLNSGTGNLSVAGTVTANSDRRIKKNIVTIESALDKVLKLRGVTYQRTDVEDDKVLMGVVAQEVEQIIPEVVSLGDPDDPDSIKSVSYGNMVGVLIEAIKEQQLQIDELKKQIESK
jgi:putative lipoic acid-binding regulatory protein